MSGESKDILIAEPLRGLLGYELRQASASAMSALAKALAPLGLRPTEASLLVLVAENPGCTQSDIGRSLCIAPANLVPIIAKLVKAGHIRREPAGPRAIGLHLDSSGNELAGAVRQTFARHETRIARQLGEAEQRQLVAWLHLIGSNASARE